MTKIKKKEKENVTKTSDLDCEFKEQDYYELVKKHSELRQHYFELKKYIVTTFFLNMQVLILDDSFQKKFIESYKKDIEVELVAPQNFLEKRKSPARQSTPMSQKIYNELIRNAMGSNYKLTRLRVACCLLSLTGITIRELLLFKVNHLKKLLELSRDRLTDEGKKMINQREDDFNYLLLRKDASSYVFTSEYKYDTMLRRETMTRDINKLTSEIRKGYETNITTCSFRKGYIFTLWKNTNDIKSVRTWIKYQQVTMLMESDHHEKVS